MKEGNIAIDTSTITCCLCCVPKHFY